MGRSLWVIIVSAGVILGIVAGIRQGFGLFLLPMSTDYGLSREAFAFAMGLQNLIWGFGAPVAGAIADRYGPRLVAAAGIVFYVAGVVVMAADWGGAQMLSSGVLLGIGMSGAGFSVVLSAVGRAAPPEHRAKALALASFGGSIGQFMALPYTHILISEIGWVTALLILGATSMLAVPLAMGLGRRVMPAPTAPGTVRLGLAASLAEAARDRSFLLLTTGFFVCGFQLAFIMVHLPPYLGDKGMAPWLGAAALTLVGVCNIAGTLACGWLGQRFEKRLVLTWLYLVRTVLLTGFMLVPVSETSVLIFAAGMGFTWLPTIPLTNGLVAQIFGPTYLSTLFGVVFLSHQLGGFVGPWVGGLVYDWTGSYDSVWWASAALGLVAALLHWPIDERGVRRAGPAPQRA
ncbi:putative MFS family arabinose efflux permease [Stella humosa]|uniref:Putative MFS family arabinose efflux permease n=1 Tax=Stella humosa TaxID=94 RepID=A0A3N1MDN9_9PROT|nr:MFS transporter [Stella humosa]ROQ01851.1 putative MFS family arabinose efflux permease [Stella humosa]BBK32240.1 MFS transporter [Stella humosa]